MAVVRWSSRARRELNALIARIAAEDLERAAMMYDRIDKAVAQLRLYPAFGRPGRVPGTRELVVPRTRAVAIYTVKQGIVRIIALHHASRAWPGDL